jgi:3-hydroxyacyl-[acyl-carrier-protein] dehydratase
MLKNDFYTCHNELAEGNQISCQVVYNAGHAIFNGHFPGNPVVPGVCMIEMVKELLQEQVQERLLLRSSGNIKFLNLITPEISPFIKIDWKKTDDGYQVKAVLNNETTVFFKFDGVYSVLQQ